MTQEQELNAMRVERKRLLRKFTSSVDIDLYTGEHLDFVAGEEFREIFPGVLVRDALPESTMITCWICVAAKDSTIHKIRHSQFKTIHMLYGKAILTEEGNHELLLSEDDTHIIAPEQTHSIYFAERSKYILKFKPKVIIQ